MTMSKSKEAIEAYKMVRNLQKKFVNKLNNLSLEFGDNKKFEEAMWLRNNGLFGGGSRFEAKDEPK